MDFVKVIITLLNSGVVFAGIIILFSLPTFARRIMHGFRRNEFKCLMCGNCCRFAIIELSEEDIKRISSAGYEDFVDETPSGEKKLLRVNGRCKFTVGDKCGIYGERPRVCRNFPFQKGFGLPYLRDWSCCPGIDEFKRRVGDG